MIKEIFVLTAVLTLLCLNGTAHTQPNIATNCDVKALAPNATAHKLWWTLDEIGNSTSEIKPGRPLQRGYIRSSDGPQIPVQVSTKSLEQFRESIDQLNEYGFSASCVDTYGRDLFDILQIRKNNGAITAQVAAEMEGYLVKNGGKARKDEINRAEERKRAEAKAKMKAEEQEAAQFKKLLFSKKPQQIYIAAGKYESKGMSSKASELYNAIIDRFPDSQWAVKASDQLSAKRLDESARASINNADRNAANRAYEQCKIEMNSCYSRGGNNCYRDCSSLLR